MFCPNCGTESNGKFCPRCGSPIKQEQAQVEAESAQVDQTPETPVDATPTEPIAAEGAAADATVQVDPTPEVPASATPAEPIAAEGAAADATVRLDQAQGVSASAAPTEPIAAGSAAADATVRLDETPEVPASAAPTEPIAAEGDAFAPTTQQGMPQDAYGQAQQVYGQAEGQQAYGQAQQVYGQAEGQQAYGQAQAQQGAYQAQQPYGAMPQGVPPQPEREPWYGKTWVIVLFLLFLWPVGLVLMWLKSCKWTKGAKIGVTVALAVLLIGSIATTVVMMNTLSSTIQNMPTRSSSISKSSSTSASSSSSKSSSSSSSQSSSSSSTKSSSSSTPSSSTKSSSSQTNSAITAECIDESGNPSLYAICQLDGKNLESLLEEYIGYSWNSSESGWVYSTDSTVVAVMNQSSTLGKSDVEKLAPAGGDTPLVYVVTAAGITTLDQALNQGNVVVEDRYTQSDGSGAAVFYGPNMKEMLVIGTPDLDGSNNGNFSMLIFNRKAFESGLATEKLGAGSQGMTMEQFWESMTGRKLNN